MKFILIDSVLERTDDRLVAVKQVSLAEEYLGDHFPTFPILPGVMMIEAMTQAARELLADRSESRLVLGGVKALKFGAMVRPGDALEVEVSLIRADDDGSFACRGVGRVRRREVGGQVVEDATAVTGRFTMRPTRAE